MLFAGSIQRYSQETQKRVLPGPEKFGFDRGTEFSSIPCLELNIYGIALGLGGMPAVGRLRRSWSLAG